MRESARLWRTRFRRDSGVGFIGTVRQLRRGGEGSERRVKELLEAHARQSKADMTETIGGLVSATVDAHFRLTAVRLLNNTLDPAGCEALEQAIVEAVNGAMQQAVTSSAEALSELRNAPAWKAAISDLLAQGRG